MKGMTPRLLTRRENGNIKNVINENIKKYLFYVFPCNQDLHIELLVVFRITE